MSKQEELNKLRAEWFLEIRKMEIVKANFEQLMKDFQTSFQSFAQEEKKLEEAIEAEKQIQALATVETKSNGHKAEKVKA